jgi:hypothetical protein
LNDILATGKLISCLLRHMPYAYPPIIHVPSQQVNGRRRAYRIRRAYRCGRAPRLVSTLSKCCYSCDLEELSRIWFSSWPHLLSLCVSAPEQASDVCKEGIELTLTRAEPQGWVPGSGASAAADHRRRRMDGWFPPRRRWWARVWCPASWGTYGGPVRFPFHHNIRWSCLHRVLCLRFCCLEIFVGLFGSLSSVLCTNKVSQGIGVLWKALCLCNEGVRPAIGNLFRTHWIFSWDNSSVSTLYRIRVGSSTQLLQWLAVTQR